MEESQRSSKTRLAAQILAALAEARQKGRRPHGVWLLEPMPGNNARLDRAFAMGFTALEVEAGVRLPLRPLVDLPVWLYGASKGNPWVQEMATRVTTSGPSCLYVQYKGQPPKELSQAVLRNPAALWQFNVEALRELVETRKAADPNCDIEELQAEISVNPDPFVDWMDPWQWVRLDANLHPSSNALLAIIDKLAPAPAPEPSPPAEKPWWEE